MTFNIRAFCPICDQEVRCYLEETREDYVRKTVKFTFIGECGHRFTKTYQK